MSVDSAMADKLRDKVDQEVMGRKKIAVKICPLRQSGKLVTDPVGGDSGIMCAEEGCAWWDNSGNQCLLVTLLRQSIKTPVPFHKIETPCCLCADESVCKLKQLRLGDECGECMAFQPIVYDDEQIPNTPAELFKSGYIPICPRCGASLKVHDTETDTVYRCNNINCRIANNLTFDEVSWIKATDDDESSGQEDQKG